MALPVWGNLEKSQIDSEKIEEAIARLIQAHEDDPDAHVEPGESLNSHKAAEIIDHVIASIVADKIKDGEIIKPKLDIRAVDFIDEKFDKGEVNNFTDFESAAVGTGSIEKRYRTNNVNSGVDQNSIAKVYTIFRESGSYWNCGHELKFDFHIYPGENWGWEVDHGAEVYIKYGMGINADMGTDSDKCFGFKIENYNAEYLRITGFARHYAGLSTIILASDVDPVKRHCLSVLREGNYYRFYIDGVLKGSVLRDIPGTVTNPYLTHVIKNPLAGGSGENTILHIGFFFPFP